MSDEVLVKVEGVSKKFCRSLKRSLWYGVQDVSAEMFGSKGSHEELRKNEFWAVNDVSFELKRGECLGLIGPNGAGKSTLLKMLNGLVKPDQGRITMRGRVGALIELGAGFNPILTARENIYVNGSVLGFSKKEIDRKFDAIVDFAEIEEFIDTPVQNYSSGMKVRLGFAVAAQMEPDVLLIDEVLAVGDAGFKAKCFTQISELSKSTAVLLVSHSMPDIARTASCIVVLASGSLEFHGENVSEGIERYSSLFDSVAPLGSDSDFGRLLGARVLKPCTREALEGSIKYLDRLVIELTFVLDVRVEACVINLGIFDAKKQQVAQCVSIKSNFVVSGSPDVQLLVVEISDQPLSLGTYSLSVYFVEKVENNRRGRIYFHRNPALTFKVFDESPGYSLVHLPAKWQLVSKAN
jgi:lipopolysaccharide transport system ATP-binding protein